MRPWRLNGFIWRSGESGATEAAIKPARQYFVEKGERERLHPIALRQSCHGNTPGRWRRGDHVLLAPPYIIEDAQITEIVDKRDASLRLALEQ